MVEVKCNICGKSEKVAPSRAKSYKSCSRECYSQYRLSTQDLNCTCTSCNKKYHTKPSQIKRYDRNMGTFCSMKCASDYKKEYYKGNVNPNFRGAQYDSDGYRVNHYPKIGRRKEHHHVVFEMLKIDKLPKDHCVHHRDCNIYNNSPENLALVSNSDHRWLHKQYGNATLWAYSQNKISLDELLDWSNDKDKAKRLLTLNILNYEGKV